MFKIGDKLSKENYTQAAIWCNKNGARIVKSGDGYVIAAIPEPTAEELAQARIGELKKLLADTDYIVIKLAEDVANRNEYATELAQRAAWRAEINALENPKPASNNTVVELSETSEDVVELYSMEI